MNPFNGQKRNIGRCVYGGVIMTYKEKYTECKSFEEMERMVKEDVKIAIFLGGNPDRIKAIEKSMNEVAQEKGW